MLFATSLRWSQIADCFHLILLVYRSKESITIVDHVGASVFNIPISSHCTTLEWSCDGDHLAFTRSGSSILSIWNSRTREILTVETNLRGLSCSAWSKTNVVSGDVSRADKCASQLHT